MVSGNIANRILSIFSNMVVPFLRMGLTAVKGLFHPIFVFRCIIKINTIVSTFKC